ncbi:MAG: phosphate starvation-inducible protein PsiF [Bradyrhizobium sp.]|nr:phosphate starvation-inducible protein PsiF [Bradyrhizobium sp.]
MITISSRAAGLAVAASLLLAGSAYAQTPSPSASPAPAATPAPTTKSGKPRSAASMECSKEADAKGLHGRERKKFRSECKQQAKDAAAPASK